MPHRALRFLDQNLSQKVRRVFTVTAIFTFHVVHFTLFTVLLNLALKAAESANDIASQVRAAFQSRVVPTFQLPENIQSSGPSGNRARGRGRSRGRGSVNQVPRYSFTVVLVNHDQKRIPRRNQRVALENSGRVKRFEILRGAPPATTFRKLCELFADVDG